QTFTHTAGENTATASFRPPPQLELYFDTHRYWCEFESSCNTETPADQSLLQESQKGRLRPGRKAIDIDGHRAPPKGRGTYQRDRPRDPRCRRTGLWASPSRSRNIACLSTFSARPRSRMIGSRKPGNCAAL